MSYNSKYTGEQVEALLDIVSQGGSGGGGEGEVQKTTEAEILAMGFTKNLGTITEVKMNGASKGSSGVVDLGTVITEHQDISGKQDVITDLESIRDGANKGATALQEIPSEYITESELESKRYAEAISLDGKVDKITGKGLSTEDFTTALKNKLESLNNYDDSEINSALEGLQSQIDTLVGGNATDAIDSFNEIVAFLDGVSNSEDLDSIIASIEQQIATKQDIIEDIDTIREKVDAIDNVIGEDGYLYSNGEKVDMRFTRSLLPVGTSIPASANLNTIEYLKIGKYYCSLNVDAETITNCPSIVAFSMEVFNPLGTNVDDETTREYTYRLRVLTNYDTGQQFIQFCKTSGTAGKWTYGDWYVTVRTKSTLNSSKKGSTSTLGSSTQGVYVDSTGTLAKMTYTLAKSVPSNAVFTDTNTKVTAVGNHYTPTENESSQIDAPEGEVVIGIKRDAAGHVVGVVTTPQSSGGGGEGGDIPNIDELLATKQDKITDLEDIREGASLGATALQSVPAEYITESELNDKNYATTTALNDKVDKVSGKGLSTEDFTTVLKGKLEGLTNYDDTTINNAVSSLQTQINTLVSGNANDAINSFNEIIAFLDGIKDTQDLASIIASIEQQIASKMDKVTLATVATSGSYNDLSNKPTIPDEVTETTVSGWGFTKNTGTYSKPSGGIPKGDLDNSVQTSLDKADTALQSYTEQYKGTVTGVKVNGSTKSPSNGVVDLGTVITAHQDISGKQDKLVSGISIKTFNGESLLGSGDITISGGSGGGSTSIIDTASSATQTTPKMLITLIKYSSTTPDGFAEGSFFTVDFTSKSITASTAGYPYYINVGGTHYKCVTSTGVEMTKNNYATLSGYYTFVRVGTTFILVNESTNSSSGSGNASSAYPQVNHGTSDTTFTLTPNTFHVWDAVGSLTLTLGSETSGVANEYLFQFTCGIYPTSLTLPDSVLWADKNFTFNANKTYQISILNGYALGIEFGKSLITFYIDGISYRAEEGMTYGQWVDSSYNTKGYYIHADFNKLTDGSSVCTDPDTKRDTVISDGTQIYLDEPAL